MEIVNELLSLDELERDLMRIKVRKVFYYIKTITTKTNKRQALKRLKDLGFSPIDIAYFNAIASNFIIKVGARNGGKE
jgi:hypothetical protein